MKRLLVLLSALLLLLPVRASAQAPADSTSGFHMAAGVSLGLMDGAGVNLAFGVTDNLYVRAGYGVIPSFLIPKYGIDLPKWGDNPATKTALSGRVAGSGNLLLDYHPGGNSFKLSAGLFFGSGDYIKAFNTDPLPETYHQAGITYWLDGKTDDKANRYRVKSDDKGVLTATFKSISIRPFVGIGFGTAVPEKRVGVTFDLGVEYIGGLDLRTNAFNRNDEVEILSLTSAGIMQTIYDIRGHSNDRSYDKYISYVDKLRSLPVLPVARVSVFVKLF